jgi:hypothetical protein
MAQAKQSHATEIEILDSDEEPSKPVPRGSISGILASANQQTNLRDKLCSLIPSWMRPNITPTKVEKVSLSFFQFNRFQLLSFSLAACCDPD